MSVTKKYFKTKIGTKLIYTFKSDVLFKMFFVKNPGLLKILIAALLDIPVKRIKNFRLINTEMPPEEIGKKFCRLDISMKVDNRRINIEIQIEDEGNYPERIIFYFAKTFAAALSSGDDYRNLPETIMISILGFKQFDSPEVHSKFMVMEVNRHEILSTKQCYHFFELPKLPPAGSPDVATKKDMWLALLNAETEEELEQLTFKGGKVMAQAVKAYRSVIATEEFKYLEELREKTRHNEASALGNAARRAKQQRDKYWTGVVADKDAALAAERAALAAERAEKEKLLREIAAMRAEQKNRN